MMKFFLHGYGRWALAIALCGLALSNIGLSSKAHLAATQTGGKLVFAAIGDSGTGNAEQFAVARAMEQVYASTPFELVLMLGDNFYGGVDYVKKFELPYAPLLAQGIKFYASLGNHDGGGKSNKETSYAKFNMGGRRYYTFTRNLHDETGKQPLAQFFALDSSQMEPAQLAWLEQTLSQSTARWKIAFFHHPLYSSGKTHGADTKLRAQLEPLFVKHGVQLVLNGHEHFYERLKPQHGVHYFISGAAGKLRRNNIRRDNPDFAFGNDQAQHFMLFEVKPDELNFRAISDAGTVLDSGTLRRVPDDRAPTVKTDDKN